MRRRLRHSRSSSSRRKFQWLGSANADDLGLTVPTTAGLSEFVAVWIRPPAGVLDSFSGEPVEIDWTLVREINCGAINYNIAGTSLGATAGMGVIVWEGVDDTVPAITQTPLPLQSPQFDWLWWWASPRAQTIFPAGTQNIHENLLGPAPNVFQSSQRKLSMGQGLLLVVEVMATSSGNDASFSWSHHSRYGYKLP